jgi:hypothetical protein
MKPARKLSDTFNLHWLASRSSFGVCDWPAFAKGFGGHPSPAS